MSETYSVSVMLNAVLNEKNLTYILSRGTEKLHFKYFEVQYENEGLLGNQLSVKEATDYIIAQIPFDEACIFIKINESFFFLRFLKEVSALTFMFSGFFYPFEKYFTQSDFEDVDVAEYAKLMLQLVSDYHILHFEIEKS